MKEASLNRFIAHRVLISTYWNVNFRCRFLQRQCQVRFNLNLLECKCKTNMLHEAEHYGFNLNLLECKS